MTKYIRTKPILGRNGKPITGKALKKALRERHLPRAKCRICGGTRRRKEKLGDIEYDVECRFCDKDGYAKFMCEDCGEALPMCRCLRESDYAAAVPG